VAALAAILSLVDTVQGQVRFGEYTIVDEIVPVNAMWRYLSPDGTAEDPGAADPNFDTTWFTPGYNDASWSGPATGPFQYATVDGLANSPTVNFLVEPLAGDRYTNYFRHPFTTTQRYTNFGVDILADDGAVVYLDGQDVLRFNCCRDDQGNDVDDYLSFSKLGGNELTFSPAPFDEGLTLEPGNHLLAVSVHQSDTGSSDLGMGLRLVTFDPPDPLPPGSVVINQGVDTFVTQSARNGPDASYGSADAWEWDGDDPGGSDAPNQFDNHALLKFNISAEQLATFGDGTATLRMFAADNGTNGDVYRMTADWLSGPNGGDNLTWNNIPGGPGLVPGTNTEAALSFATGDIPEGVFIYYDVTGDIKAWAGGQTNYGWGFFPTANNGVEISSFETVNPPALLLIPSAPIGPALQAGDADQDLDFDQFDLIKVQIAAKYLTGQAATWGEGDWNGAPGGRQGSPPAGDARFNQLDIIAAQLGNKYLMGKYGALTPSDGVRGDGQTSIVYNPATGEVAVDAPATTQLTSINIDSAGRIFTGAPATNLGGSFDNDADNNIFKATFGSSFGSLSFGNVAQPGLSKAFVTNDLTVVGSLAGGGALGPVDLIYVPEPTSMLLLACALLALAAYGWRR
jgi:hypothetical protein